MMFFVLFSGLFRVIGPDHLKVRIQKINPVQICFSKPWLFWTFGQSFLSYLLSVYCLGTGLESSLCPAFNSTLSFLSGCLSGWWRQVKAGESNRAYDMWNPPIVRAKQAELAWSWTTLRWQLCFFWICCGLQTNINV